MSGGTFRYSTSKVFESWTDGEDDDDDDPPNCNYCPNCGAKVTEVGQ